MRLLDKASCKTKHKLFINRIIDNKIVWYLSNKNGTAYSISNNDEETVILMFWSDQAYTQQVKNNGFDDYDIAKMDLFDFLYRWLPGMSGDNVLIGTNWTYDLIGLEFDPFELREKIENNMPRELNQKYKMKYDKCKK